jgi:hypothetical protein
MDDKLGEDWRTPIVRGGLLRHNPVMRVVSKMIFLGLFLLISVTGVWAAEQSRLPADQAVQQNVSRALIQAGIDPRRTSVQVVTTADHTIYLSGLISDRDTIKLAGTVAGKAAPSWRVVNTIRSSFFADPNHVNADKTK